MCGLFVGSMVLAACYCAALFGASLRSIQKPVSVPVPPAAGFPDIPADQMADLSNPSLPISVRKIPEGNVRLVMVEGGVAGTERSPIRRGVRDIVEGCGATAGLNGTFFANASLRGTDNKLIGPSLCEGEQQVTLSPFDRRPQLEGRPLVLISPDRTMIVPYDPQTMDSQAAIRTALPGLTDTFVGGVWLVHHGEAADDQKIASFQIKDANDYRRRSFFAIMPDGRPVLGATDGSLPSRDLAQDLQTAGVQEAVLLDSGFSTSLVYEDQILVSGHSTPRIPSRPIPHAIVLFNRSQVALRHIPQSHISG